MVDANGAEPVDMFDPPDRDDLLDFEDAWRDRDDAGADHGVDDVDDGATCSSLRMDMSSKKFFVIVLGVQNNGSVA